jgi:photosystem II stability/assembly factor-like uncharacterized protein
VYAGVLFTGLSSGVLISEDGGRSWREPVAGLKGTDVFSLVQSQVERDVLYAGTNRGIFMSKDLGESWRRKPWKEEVGAKHTSDNGTRKEGFRRAALRGGGRKGRKVKPRPSESAFQEVYQISVGKAPDLRLLAATPQGVFQESVTRTSWTKIFQAKMGERVLTLYPSPSKAGHILVGTNLALYSTLDNGRTWVSSRYEDQPLAVSSIIESKEAPGTYIVGTSLGLYRWASVGVRDRWWRYGGGLPALNVSMLKVNNDDPRNMIVGDGRWGGLYLSNDRGASWRRIDVGFINPRVACATFDMNDVRTFYVGIHSGGIYIGQPMSYPTHSANVGEGKE